MGVILETNLCSILFFGLLAIGTFYYSARCRKAYLRILPLTNFHHPQEENLADLKFTPIEVMGSSTNPSMVEKIHQRIYKFTLKHPLILFLFIPLLVISGVFLFPALTILTFKVLNIGLGFNLANLLVLLIFLEAICRTEVTTLLKLSNSLEKTEIKENLLATKTAILLHARHQQFIILGVVTGVLAITFNFLWDLFLIVLGRLLVNEFIISLIDGGLVTQRGPNILNFLILTFVMFLVYCGIFYLYRFVIKALGKLTKNPFVKEEVSAVLASHSSRFIADGQLVVRYKHIDWNRVIRVKKQ